MKIVLEVAYRELNQFLFTKILEIEFHVNQI